MFRLLTLIFSIQAILAIEISDAQISAQTTQMSMVELKHDINQLNNRLAMLHDDNQNLRAIVNNPKKINPYKKATYQEFVYIAGLSAIIFLLALATCIEKVPTPLPQRRPAPRPKPIVKQLKEDSEYDFMSSKEAIPAKFNLIEAYISMKQHDLAKKELDWILNIGNVEQRDKAKLLLNQLI